MAGLLSSKTAGFNIPSEDLQNNINCNIFNYKIKKKPANNC